MDDVDDEITTAFKGISPEMLIRETSAISDTPMSFDSVGQAMFDEFVDGMVNICWERTKNETFEAFAVLGAVRRRRIFLSQGDETPEDWANRLRREAEAMDATWFFTSMLAPARTYSEGAPPPEFIEATSEAIDLALDEGKLNVCVCWTAQRHDDNSRSKRAGVIYLDNNAHPDRKIEGVLNDDEDNFVDIIH